jgi:hypothetical protein
MTIYNLHGPVAAEQAVLTGVRLMDQINESVTQSVNHETTS